VTEEARREKLEVRSKKEGRNREETRRFLNYFILLLPSPFSLFTFSFFSQKRK